MKTELYKTKEEIENWLNKYEVKNYQLIEDNEYGYVVDVNGYVNLSCKDLEYIKVKFNIINGDFDCSYNNLKLLKGCPKEIKGFFSCANNKLTTLEGCSKIINGNFLCNNNKLKTLDNCSKIIMGKFDCSNNQLKTLEYFPEKVDNKCYFNNNPELGQIQEINNFEELKKIHDSIVLNNKLEKEIIVNDYKNNSKIKL